jgi:hypothetical protein
MRQTFAHSEYQDGPGKTFPTDKPTINQSQYKDVLERARKRYAEAVAAEEEMRREALIDLEFLAGNQWDPKVKMERERGKRPCLVFNKVLPPVTQLGNQARQNKPAIKVSPVDSGADPETAKVISGLMRHIEYDSDAEQAYDTALFYAAGCGFGYWRYTCEYEPKSFDQCLKTVTVEDPFTIYLDCYARKPDRSDAKWGFVVDRLPNDAHEARFGPDEADLSADFSRELATAGWRDEDSKMIAEYWEVDSETKTLRTRVDEDGTHHNVYLEDLGEDEDPDAMDWATDDDGKIQEREEEIPRVMLYIINGAAVLEEPVKWDGETIPIVKLTGLEIVIRGQRRVFSMTRFARDPQQLLNFYKTMEAESIALAPKPKFVGAVGQFKSKRRDWARANTDNAAFLEYDSVDVNGKPLGAPQWHTFDPPVQAFSIGSGQAVDDIKSSTGYFDPSLGINKSDQSGIAIKQLQQQGDVSNFHFMDNLARALKRGGRILLDLIPKKYDTDRVVRIIGEDQKQRIVRLNAPYQEDGKARHHRLEIGRYDLRVEQGTSYTSQRQETREMLMALAKGAPDVWKIAADIFFENQDFIGADRLAQRFRALLPPAVQESENTDVPPQVQAQLAQMKQALEAKDQAIQHLSTVIKTKVLELESKERIATEANRTKIVTAAELSKSASMNRLAELDHAAVEHQLDLRADLLHKAIDIHTDAAQAMESGQQGQPQGQPPAQPQAPAQGATQ